MAGNRVFNFNGANVTFNDIHDNNNCTIIVPKGKDLSDDYCTYIVPEPKRSRDEIETDLERTSHETASVFAKCLLRLYKNGELDFGGDTVKTIFTYLKQRYNLAYGYPNFSAVFTLPMK